MNTYTLPEQTELVIVHAEGDARFGLEFTITINGNEISGEFRGEDGQIKLNAKGYEESIIRMLFTCADPSQKIQIDADSIPQIGTYTFTKAELDAWAKDYADISGTTLTWTDEQIMALTEADVLSVYSGKPGCACGCRGKHSYNPAYRKNRGYVEIKDCNITMIRKVLGIIKANITNTKLKREDSYLAIELENASGNTRVYIAYIRSGRA